MPVYSRVIQPLTGMSMHFNRRLPVLAALLFLPLFVSAQELQKFASVRDALAAGRQLNGQNGPQNVNWFDGGKSYSFIEYNAEKRRSEIKARSIAKNTVSTIFDGEGITFPGTDQTFQYTAFQWAADSRHLVFSANFRPVYRNSGLSDYYLYNVESKALTDLVKDARTAELSPDGKSIVYERGGNLFSFDLNAKTEKQLTTDGDESKFVFNGRFGWVYEEEFGLVQAWSWSNDSRFIAYWQQDESQVPITQITDYNGQHPEWTRIPYPKVGDPNPVTKIGVVDVTTGKNVWLETGEATDSYIPRIYWTARKNTLAVQWMNREQNHLKVYLFDVTTGVKTLVLEEKSTSWIDVFDFFAGIMDLMFFPDGLEEFFWVSDRDGWQHIYRYDYTGKLLNQVTNGKYEVTYVNGIDVKNKTVYFLSTEVSPLERHLYSVKFDGKGKKKLSSEPGTHAINMSPDQLTYIDRYSNVNLPTQVELRTTAGKLIEKLVDNKTVQDFVKTIPYAKRELMTATASDGQKLDLFMVKPADFDSSRSYPVVFDIYGGPGAQSVYNQWGGTSWHQFLAQQGYIVVSVNNRGTGNYGRDFEKIVYGKLGRWEANDFAEVAKWLAKKSWIDASNMAIRGHSYGGYMTATTLARHPGVFKLGIVGAPVIDWRLYDSIYAERYMGLKPGGDARYDSAAVTFWSKNTKDRVLLAHSAMDDNVHMQNTMQYISAMIEQGKDLDLRIYPKGNHGVAYNQKTNVLLYETYVKFLEETLKGLKPAKSAQ
jgi:dipeptidyl-peptidase-4